MTTCDKPNCNSRSQRASIHTAFGLIRCRVCVLSSNDRGATAERGYFTL